MTTKQILSNLNVLAWIAFIGMCIKTGTIIFNLVFSIFIDSEGLKNFYLLFDFSDLIHTNFYEFISLMSLLIFISIIQSYLSYIIIKLFEKINMENPFSEVVSNLITKISYLVFGIGILNEITKNYAKVLIKKGINLPDINEFTSSNSVSELIFLSGIIYVIAQIFKRGIELQNENDLTI